MVGANDGVFALCLRSGFTSADTFDGRSLFASVRQRDFFANSRCGSEDTGPRSKAPKRRQNVGERLIPFVGAAQAIWW